MTEKKMTREGLIKFIGEVSEEIDWLKWRVKNQQYAADCKKESIHFLERAYDECQERLRRNEDPQEIFKTLRWYREACAKEGEDHEEEMHLEEDREAARRERPFPEAYA